MLVEGKTDVHFWTTVFERAGAAGRFKIYSQYQFPTADSSGKATLEAHFLPFADRELWICIDSDHDYLLETEAWQKPFVFQTKVHSVENYQCFAPSLNAVLQKNTDDPSAFFDFEEYLKAYGNLYRNMVVRLYQKNVRAGNEFIDYQFDKLFVEHHNQSDFTPSLEIAAALSIFPIPEFSEEEAAFAYYLETLGLSSDSTYLFFRGHNVKNEVVLKLLKKLAKPITNAQYATKNREGIAIYQQHLQTNSFEKLLVENDGFSEFHLYKLLVSEITQAVALPE